MSLAAKEECSAPREKCFDARIQATPSGKLCAKRITAPRPIPLVTPTLLLLWVAAST